MLAWRLICCKIYAGELLSEGNETKFTTNPQLFCGMLKKVLKDLNEGYPEYIRSYYDLQSFDENDLELYFKNESKETIFTVKWDYDEPIEEYKIETAEILV